MAKPLKALATQLCIALSQSPGGMLLCVDLLTTWSHEARIVLALSLSWHKCKTILPRSGLKSIVGGWVVQVVNQALDSGAVWGGTAQLLDGKADVLVGAGTAADVAGGAGGDEQSLASNDLLLGQGGGLALVVDLRCPQVCL